MESNRLLTLLIFLVVLLLGMLLGAALALLALHALDLTA